MSLLRKRRCSKSNVQTQGYQSGKVHYTPPQKRKPQKKKKITHTHIHAQNKVRCSVNIFNLSGSIQHLRTKGSYVSQDRSGKMKSQTLLSRRTRHHEHKLEDSKLQTTQGPKSFIGALLRKFIIL